MRVHFFNPYNDLALAAFSPSYTPPRNAALIADAGGALPFWFAEPGDSVIASREAVEWIEKMKQWFEIPVMAYNTAMGMECIPCPWGWSPDMARKFRCKAVNTAAIPSSKTIEEIRQLSHRRTSIAINRRLAEAGIPTPPPAVEITDPAAVPDSPDLYFKSPWSSSGRGVFHAGSLLPQQARAQAEGMIRRQGSVIAEKALDKILDFAMLFVIDCGNAAYRGLSLFSCNSLGAYTGNVVAPQPMLQQQICSFGVSLKELRRIADTLEGVLTDIIGTTYTGPLGIDMMVYRQKNGMSSIAPCIELNLRNTMGHVALALAERYLHPLSLGQFTVTPESHFRAPDNIIPSASTSTTPETTAKMPVRYTDTATAILCGPDVTDRKLRHGSILLTPPGHGFEFRFSASPLT